ncbi:MAG: LysM peptidoglycan-binding domain-containing protein [Verrucomicrobiales bacterium]
MSAMATLSFSTCLLFFLPLSNAETLAELQRRCAEQERQIAHLEQENSRLRSGLLDTSLPTGTTTTPAGMGSSVTGAVTSPAPPSPAEAIHVVQAGDTLSGIAKQHGTRTSILCELNDLKNAGMIRVGQKIKLPTPLVSSSQPSSSGPLGETYQVKKGDTFFGIARNYGMTVAKLEALNPSVNPRALRIGQKLRLSEKASPEELAQIAESPTSRGTDVTGATSEFPSSGTQTILHHKRPTVERVAITEEITLQAFADKYSMDVARLKRLNGLSDERYHPNTVLAEGSALFVSAPPLD